jgi:Na+/H+ antiporter NhaD/arsenite permease-like protein
MIATIFYIWNVLLLVSIALIFLRNDWREMFNDIFSQLFTPNLLGFIAMVFVLYIFLPLTIPYSIKNILGIKNEDK